MPGRETIRMGVGGGTPGADSNTYTLFDSTTAFTGGLPSHDISRIAFGVNNSQAGTLNAYFSVDSGVTWSEYSTTSVTAASSPAMSGPFDFLVDTYPDFRLQWVNGGSAQATWIPTLTAVRNDRASGT